MLRRRAVCLFVFVVLATAVVGPIGAEENAVITLTNKDWDHGALIEVKRGKAQNPADNPDFGSKTLQKGESWSVPCEGQEVVWRRKALGYSDEAFTPWNRDSCFDSTSHDI